MFMGLHTWECKRCLSKGGIDIEGSSAEVAQQAEVEHRKRMPHCSGVWLDITLKVYVRGNTCQKLVSSSVE